VTRITCEVPTKAPFGALKLTIKTKVGTSNARRFRVRR